MTSKSKAFNLVEEMFRANLQPEPILTVSQWAEKNRILTTETSAEAGPWQNERTPYLVEIMDCLSPTHPCEKVVFEKASQVGGTECGNNWLGFIISESPAPTMLVLPTIELAKRTSNQRISKLLDSTPSIKNKVKGEGARKKTDQTLMKGFVGMDLIIAGANSASSLKSSPCAYLFFDEVDEFVQDLNGQGDPISLAMVRSRTFASRAKAFLVSSPTIEGASKIDDEFEASDKRFYNVPCPHCNEKQVLKFENLQWEGKDDLRAEQKIKEAVYYCEHCGEAIEEFEKQEMLRKGVWIPTAVSDVPGFHINTLYSPWFAWWKVARDYVEAQREMEEEKKTSKMKVFRNTIEGKTWKESGEAPEWKKLYDRREGYEVGVVPSKGVILTAGCDVQKDRLEIEVVAWSEGKESYSVDYQIIPGDTSKQETWDKLTEYIEKEFDHIDGHALPIQLVGIDSGYRTQEVYNYCRKFASSRVIPLKGRDEQPVAIAPPQAVDVVLSTGKKLRRGIKLWNIGVSILKSELYGHLKLEPLDLHSPEPLKGFCHFPQYSEEYFKQLCAEELREKKDRRNQVTHEWVKTRERNEALDCRIYARACSIVLGIDRFRQKDWEARKVKKIVKPLQSNDNEKAPAKSQEQVKKKKVRRTSDFWG